MILAIDIGNTNTVLGLFANSQLIESWRLQTEESRTIDESWAIFRQLVDGSKVDLTALSGVVIGSVVPKLTFVLRKMSINYLNIEPLEVNGSLKLGIELRVDAPREVGSDRIANSFACGYLYGMPSIVIDFGTATTYDVIDEKGNFIGGAIAPGIEISANYLLEKAALLHRIDFTVPANSIGTNTQTNLTSGILFGAADMVDGMIKRIKKEKGWGAIPVVVTGGLGKVIAGISQSITHFDENLTLKGLYHIYKDHN
ncbi:MAG: type III pantothenate kinase [Candidatus Marinimicrobia bacterium]|nr:type III pantothenate kinase [Candidatus Neomarinimicrobiota bacterium]